MKVLFLTHPESDYGAAFALNGFCRAIGHENVYDYPVKPTYHGKDDNGYPRPWCDDGPGTTGRFPWMADGYEEKPLDHEAVSGLLRDGYFDIVVLESWRWTVQRTWDALKDDIRASGAKIILHDGEDYHSFNGDALETVRPDYYLKRELLKNYDFGNQSGPIVLPFPFSAPDQIIEWADRQPPAVIERDIACLLGLSWQPRQELADELRRGMDAGEYTGYIATNADSDRNNPQHLLGFWEYLELLRTSRFGVSMRGHGFDSCRYWECAVLTGLLADKLDIQIPHPFTWEECTYVSYDDIAKARAKARFIAENPHIADELRHFGILHARKYHTNSARVKLLLEQVVD
jgi:hypothetical protein